LELIDDLWRDVDRRARMGARPADILLDAGAWVTATYRVGRAISNLPAPLRLVLRAVHRPVEWVLRRATRTTLPVEAEIGGGLYLSQTSGIRVAKTARIGRDCNLSGGAILEGGPYVGDRVYIGPGARIAGEVRVGNDAAIGARALVETDVPDGGLVGSTSRAIEVRGRRRPETASAVRSIVRDLLPKPAQLLVRPG
jgi:serine O-acetyltransferase